MESMNDKLNYKQQSNQGCLVTSLMYMNQINPTRESELELLSDGLFRLRENFTLGCTLAFLEKHKDKSVIIYVDNKYFMNILKGLVNHPRLKIAHNKNDKKLLDSLDANFIVYVDNNITDGWTHLPHFMLVVGATEKFYKVFDPWEGKILMMSKSKLISGIDLLRSHVKLCPFVIAVD